MGKHIVWNDEKGLGHTSRQRNNLSSASYCIVRRCRSLMGKEQSVNSLFARKPFGDMLTSGFDR